MGPRQEVAPVAEVAPRGAQKNSEKKKSGKENMQLVKNSGEVDKSGPATEVAPTVAHVEGEGQQVTKKMMRKIAKTNAENISHS